MISRRRLLVGGAALVAASSLRARQAKATVTGIAAGAIRWDAWYGNTGASWEAQQNLGPQKWQFRAPWFCSVQSPFALSCTPTQANMDTEIRLAAQAGIKYFAFCWYGGMAIGNPPSPPLNQGWNFYNASSYNSLIKWCVIGGISIFGAADAWSNNHWQANCNQWVGYFQQSNYMTVFGGRPLVYILWQPSEVTSWFAGSLTNVAAAISYVRSQCTAAGIGNPYIVILYGPYSTSFFSTIGADAISNYTSSAPLTAAPDVYATLDTGSAPYWASLVATGLPVVPICQTGWDTRPRKEHSASWGKSRPRLGDTAYFAAGTPAQVAAHIQNGINFIGNNPAACPSKALLIYSWNECDEGGNVLCPTLGDPPVNTDPGQPLLTSNMLAAVGPVLRAAA